MIYAALMAEEGLVADRVLSVWGVSAAPSIRGTRRSLVARALLQAMLQRGGRINRDGWSISSTENGRPFAIDRRENPSTISVSLSHSHGWVAAALGTSDVGIDIEAHRARPRLAQLAEQAFGPAEAKRALQGGGIAQFYRIWTLREAIAKAQGLGLSMVSDRADRADGGPTSGDWASHVGDETWYLHHSIPVPNLSLAVATKAHAAGAGSHSQNSGPPTGTLRISVVRGMTDLAAFELNLPLHAGAVCAN